MNFGFTEEQEMLRDQVVRFMKDALPMPRVREIAATPTGIDRELWKQAADLGWLGLTIPEANGGLGLKWIDLVVVLEETARGLSPLPIASQALASAAILRLASEAHQSQWLPAMASGDAIVTLGLYDDPNWIDPGAIQLAGRKVTGGIEVDGTKPFVADAPCADYILAAIRCSGLGPDGIGLAAAARDQVSVKRQPIMDQTKPMGSVTFDKLVLPEEYVMPMSIADLAYLTDCGAVAVTAEMVGAADAIMHLTSEYAKQRIQFGKPIGQYQGVKHRLADIFVDVESCRSLLYYAAWTADDEPAALPRAISMAKGYASDAFAQIGIDGVGLHGAIGFTAEYDAQLYLKRSKWARPMYGDSDYHLDRIAAEGGL